MSLEEAKADYLFEDSDTLYIAAWNGHEFEAIRVVILQSESAPPPGTPRTFHIQQADTGRDRDYQGYEHAEESVMDLYYPVDPRMTLQDVRGATVTYANEDNTGWLFSHCDEDYMIDHEENLVAVLEADFGPVHRAISGEANSAILGYARNQNETWLEIANSANLLKILLESFHADTEAALRSEARSRHLGYYHQNPEEAHIHRPIERALRATIAAWEADTTEKAQSYN